jgi:hypothetical protein
MNMETVKHEGIFKSAQEAVVFACNYADQQYAMSPMAKILQRGAHGSGRGLIGLDGAAQSGMVLAELQRLDYWHMLVLVARSAPRREQCSCNHACCSGWKANPLYQDAVSQLSDLVVAGLGGAVTLRRFRIAVIARHFGEKLKVRDIAEDLGIPPRTAERHASAITAYLKDVEKTAWSSLYAQLDDAGMLISETA